LVPNDIWLSKKKSVLKGGKFKDKKNIKKCEDGTESYSTTAVP
jgi:hypothetical protein